MDILYIGIGTFFLVFSIFFFFSYRGEKKENEKGAFWIALLVSTVFGLIITLVLLFFILAYTGSLSMINSFFDLSLNQKQIIYLVIIYFFFGLLFENFPTNILAHFMGRSRIAKLVAVGIVRMVFIFTVSELLEVEGSMKVTLAMTIFLYFLDAISDYFQKTQAPQSKNQS